MLNLKKKNLKKGRLGLGFVDINTLKTLDINL